MTSVADIQKDLPGWPEEVVEQWLHYFANEQLAGRDVEIGAVQL